VLTAVVTRGSQIDVGLQIDVTFIAAEGEEGETMTYEESLSFCEFPFKEDEFAAKYEETGYPCKKGPSPLAPEPKELLWGGGSFIVLLIAMRYWLFPAVKKGMDARYGHIRAGHEQADAARSAARAEVADYESALAGAKAEANGRIEAARATLDAERTAKLADVNARIAAKREAAAEAARAAREAARADVTSAAADVAGRTVELSIGRAPNATAVRSAVDAELGAGVGS
jgi:F-type H+-transporting ATPase subunit b